MKRLSFHYYIISFLFTLLPYHIYSQCDSLNQPSAGFECIQTSFNNYVCDFNGMCLNMEPGSWGGEAGFCGGGFSLQNPHWYSFVSNGAPINLDIFVESCTGQGIQWALYDNCNNLVNALICNGGGTNEGGTINIVYDNAIAGQNYYLLVDGSSGGTCVLKFIGNSGVAPVDVQAGADSVLIGDINICPTTSNSFSFAGFQYGNIYEWSIDGVSLDTTNNPSISFIVPALAEGTHELCVKGTNNCDTVGLLLCWDLSVTRDQTITVNEIVCPGDSVLYQNAFYKAGNYTLDYTGLNTCIESVALIVEEYYLPPDTTYSAFICYDLNSFENSGTIYQTDSLYENVPFKSEGGCFYTGKLLVSQLDISQYNITATLDELPCNAPFYSTLTLEGPVVPAHISNRIAWFNSAGEFLGEGKRVDVDQPGDYNATVNQIYSYAQPLDNELRDTCTLTFNYTISNLTEIVTDPVLAPGLQTPETGEYEVKITNPENYPSGTEFIWIVPSGILYTEITDGLSIYLPVEGTYKICVYAQDDCSRSDSSCFDIIITQTLGSNAPFGNHFFRLRQNPVGDYLIIDMNNDKKEQFNIRVFDINGSVLKDEKAVPEGSVIKLGVQDLQSGVYIFQISDEGRMMKTGKFVKI